MSRSYDDELERFSRQLSDEALAATTRGRKEFNQDLQILSSLRVVLRFLVERGDVNKAPAAIRILYAKLVDCLGGVHVLLHEGLPGPATMVLRSLFETSVHLQVVLKRDVPARCQLFEDFLLIQRDRVSSGSGVPPEKIAQNARRLASVRSNYHPTKPHSWCWQVVPGRLAGRKTPSNPSLRDLCVHIGHEDYYKQIYGHLSEAIHPVPSYEVWMRRADGNMELGPKFNEHTRLVAKLASALTVDAAARTLEYLRPSDQLDLSRLFVGLIVRPD